MSLLNRDDAVLLIVDIQVAVLKAMRDAETVVANTARLIEGAKLFSVPIVLTLQNPERLGGCPEPVEAALPPVEPIHKMVFSCCEEPSFVEKLREIGRKQVMLLGIESHVCVLQTAHDLTAHGYEVHVVQDACSSRTEANWRAATERLRDIGCVITTTEMAIFELTRQAGTPEFKQVLSIVK